MVPHEYMLLELLSNNDVTFFIPPYQRNYEWTDEQCEVFLGDIIKTYEANEKGIRSEHFFGSATYFRTATPFGQPSKLVLIDGQQRITTTMLFLAALRDVCADAAIKSFIDTKYLKNNNAAGDSEYKIKLKQVETDWQTYKKLILSEEISGKEKESAVYRNYNYFYNKLSAFKDKDNKLFSLIENGLAKFSIISIELQPEKNPWENPQEIFESMNSLGKPLSLADLVRNYLLMGLEAETQNNLYNKYWLEIERTVPKNVSDFIRDFMQCDAKQMYPKATEKNYKALYSNFKDYFQERDAASLLKDLLEYAKIYAWIIGESSPDNKKVNGYLADLRRLNVTTAYSFLLALMHAWQDGKLSEDDIIVILDVFRIYCLRRRILGLNAAENKNFPALARRISELINAQDKGASMFEILAKQENNLRLPNDIEITRTILDMNFYNFQYCKFFLALVEEKLTKQRPDLASSDLQIEHIMPQTLTDEWKEALGEDYENVHQLSVHTIGNLTLIRHNKELGQKVFAEKKKIYKNNAGLQIAQTKITNHDYWNDETIKERAAWIIEFLVKEVMPIPDKMRKTNNFITTGKKGLSFQELQLIGLYINFAFDKSFTAKVVSDKEVEFEGKKWKLSPLTKEIQTRRGKVNASGAYQGAQYWEYDGIRLADII